ncbi:hypothetical protein Lepto7375DRAFT_0668 [Leptolyngbya sp. PCC 7375]|nr:hypothetical protein Lepto7375DRAFT_0668 [Leptolyngbya sp. PCC 7375]
MSFEAFLNYPNLFSQSSGGLTSSLIAISDMETAGLFLFYDQESYLSAIDDTATDVINLRTYS